MVLRICKFILKLFIMFIFLDIAAKVYSSFQILTSVNLRRYRFGPPTSFVTFYEDPEFEYVDRWFEDFLRSYEPASGIKAIFRESLANIKEFMDLTHVAESYSVEEIDINYESSETRRHFVDPELYIDVEEVYNDFDSPEMRRTLVDPELYVDVENLDSSLQEKYEDLVDMSEIDSDLLLEDWEDEDFMEDSISKAPTPTKMPSSLPSSHISPSSAPYGFPISSPAYDSQKIFSFPTYSPAVSHSDPPTPAAPFKDPVKSEISIQPYSEIITSDESECERYADDKDLTSEETPLVEEDHVAWQQWCIDDCEQPTPQDSIRCPLLLIFNVLILSWVIHCIFSKCGYELDTSLILTFPVDNHTTAQDQPCGNPTAEETQTEEWEVIQEREMSDKDDFVLIN